MSFVFVFHSLALIHQNFFQTFFLFRERTVSRPMLQNKHWFQLGWWICICVWELDCTHLCSSHNLTFSLPETSSEMSIIRIPETLSVHTEDIFSKNVYFLSFTWSVHFLISCLELMRSIHHCHYTCRIHVEYTPNYQNGTFLQRLKNLYWMSLSCDTPQ